MQNRKSIEKTAKSSSKYDRRDLKTPLGSFTQDQIQPQPAENYQHPLESEKFTNLGMNGKKLEEFESPHRPCQAQNISHLPKITELRTKHSDRRDEDISPQYPAESTHLLLASDRQLRGGGKSEGTSKKEAQDKHLTSLLHKIDKYKIKIQGDTNFETELETYIKPLGKPDLNHEPLACLVREPFELELEIKKRLLDSESDLKVLLLTGEAGIGKSSFCKYLQRAMLVDWEITQWDESQWLPILVDLSNLMRSREPVPRTEAAKFTISEILKQELSLTESEIKLLQESEGESLHLPRFLFIFDEYDQIFRREEQSKNIQWTLEDCIQNHFCKSIGFETFEKHAKIILTARPKTFSHLKRSDLLFSPLERSKSPSISNYVVEFELQPFTDDQISSYLKKYFLSNMIGKAKEDFQVFVHSSKSESWNFVEKIQVMIDSYGLRKFVQIPLNLWMFLQVLPDLFKNFEATKTGVQNMSKFRLYQLFTSQVMKDTAIRFLASQENQNEEQKQYEEKVDSLLEKLKRQLQRLALLDWCPYPSNIDTEIMIKKDGEKDHELLKLCPLLRVDDTHADHLISFAQESYQPFFVATKIIEEILNQPNNLQKMLFNQKSLNSETFPNSILHFLVDAVNDQIISALVLIELIQKSRINDDWLDSPNFLTEEKEEKKETEPQFLRNFSIAAANAITILNTAGYDFHHQDFSKVCIADANLSYGLFEGTNFSRADLQGVNFSGAWLKEINFEYANMDRVQLGMVPNLPLEKEGLCIAYSPTGTHLVIGSRSEIIILRKCADKISIVTEEKRLKGHIGDVRSCSFSMDGKYLLSGGDDRTVRIWDFELGKCIKILEKHKSSVISCKFSPDGKQIISLDEDQTIKKWDLSAGEWTLSFELHVHGAEDCGFIPGYKSVIYLWNIFNGPVFLHSRTGKYIGNFNNSLSHLRYRGGFNFDGRQMVVDIMYSSIKIFDCLRRQLTKSFDHMQQNYYYSSCPAPSFCTYDLQILSANGTTVRIRDAATGKYEEKNLYNEIKSYSIDPASQSDVVGLTTTALVFLENVKLQKDRFEKIEPKGINQKGFNIAGANIDSTKGLSTENIMIFDQIGDYKGFGHENIKELILNDQISSLMKITDMNLSDRNLSSQGAKIIGRNIKWMNLKKLDLSRNGISEEGAIAIAKNKTWKELQELILYSNNISDKGVIAISENPCWTNLRKLELESNCISDLGAKALGMNSMWEMLEVLDLSDNSIGEEGTIAIGCNVTWAFLKKLDLKSNKVRDEGAKVIANNETWIRLEELCLAGNMIGDLGATEIGRNTSWKNLKVLSLESNAFSDTGATVIAENKTWTKLEELYLYCNPLSEEFTNKLEKNISWTNMAVLICKIENSTLQDFLSEPETGYVSITGEKLSDTDATIIGRTKTVWKVITELSLWENEIGNLGAAAIGANITWSKLRELSLQSNRIGDEGAVAIGSNTTWTNLERLYLHENEIGDKGAIALGANTTWRKLKELTLGSNRIGDEGAVSIGSNITWTNLERLYLHANEIGDKGAIALGANTSWNKLEELTLGSNRIGDEGAVSIGSNTSWINLKELYLHRNEIGNKGAAALGANTTWTKLRVLSLLSSMIGDEGAVSIGLNTTWENLEHLYLWGNSIGNLGAAAIGANITWSKLRVLSLHSNRIGDGGAVSIGSNTTWKNLEQLYLNQNEIGDLGAAAIGANTSWSNLKELTLGVNRIGDEGAVSIGSNITWTNLEVLQLSKNEIGDAGASAIGSNAVWKNLKQLLLGGNNISDKGATIIGSNETWNNLEILTLDENHIGDPGAVAIAKNITWGNLKSLSLNTNKIGDEGILSLSQNTVWTELEVLKVYNNPFKNESSLHQAFSGEPWGNLKIFLPSVSSALRDFLDSIKSEKSLTEVRLCSKALNDDDAIILASRIPRILPLTLEVLVLSQNNIGDKGASLIGVNDAWWNLRKLDLSANKISDAGVEAIGKNGTWDSLQELSLAHNQFGNQGVISIEKTLTFRNLIKLDLSANRIGDEGANILGLNVRWIYLEELYLQENEIGDQGAKAIGGNKAWKKLVKLEIHSNKHITEIGKEQLKKNPIFGQFVHV